MKCYKKIVSSILAAVSTMTMFSVNTMAQENIKAENICDLADTLSFQLDLYYDDNTIEQLKHDGIYMGTSIPAYYEDEVGILEIYTQVDYYPVYSNGDVIGIFNVYHGEYNDTYSDGNRGVGQVQFGQ